MRASFPIWSRQKFTLPTATRSGSTPPEILADYLTGSNEAPLTRAFLERGLSQDVSLAVDGGILQPSTGLSYATRSRRNSRRSKPSCRSVTETLCRTGLDRDALLASLERAAFLIARSAEPYGIELAIQSLQSWLYGGDPLMWLDNTAVFASLREKADTSYFTDLLRDLLGGTDDKCWLYVLPSQTKGAEDAAREDARLAAVTADWTEADFASHRAEREALLRWQQTPDTEEALAALPHLRLRTCRRRRSRQKRGGRRLRDARCSRCRPKRTASSTSTSTLTFRTSHGGAAASKRADRLLRRAAARSTMPPTGSRAASRRSSASACLAHPLRQDGRPRRLHAASEVTAGMLEEHTDAALDLLRELLLCGRYDETDASARPSFRRTTSRSSPASATGISLPSPARSRPTPA